MKPWNNSSSNLHLESKHTHEKTSSKLNQRCSVQRYSPCYFCLAILQLNSVCPYLLFPVFAYYFSSENYVLQHPFISCLSRMLIKNCCLINHSKARKKVQQVSATGDNLLRTGGGDEMENKMCFSWSDYTDNSRES